MLSVASFTFNPFQENTYVLFDDSMECIVIDPGCFDAREEQALTQFIEQKKLKVVRLINTHCHIDHVFGNQFIADTYGVDLEIHRGELPVLQAAPQVAKMYGLGELTPFSKPIRFLEEGKTVEFGNTTLDILFTPGHSPASICFYNKADHILIGGDVLFRQSIGRTDLPGGDYNTLIQSIKTQLLPLPDEVTVYSGHGPHTTIGFERENNPFIK